MEKPPQHKSVNTKLLQLYIKDARRRRLTERTIENYHSSLRIFFEYINKPAADISIDDLQDFLDYLTDEKELKDSSISRYFSALRSFYDFLEFENMVTKNIIPNFGKRYLQHLTLKHNSESERQIISEEKMAQLITSILDPRDKAVVSLLAKTGVRRNELINIDIGDIDWVDYSITLKPTRKRNNRIVFFDHETAVVLKRWMTTREGRLQGENKRPLFINEQQGRLNRNGVYNIVTKYAERIGLHDPATKDLGKKFSPHNCRHWFTTVLLRSKMKTEYVKELRGDSRSEAIDIYHHIDREELKKAFLSSIPQLGVV